VLSGDAAEGLTVRLIRVPGDIQSFCAEKQSLASAAIIAQNAGGLLGDVGVATVGEMLDWVECPHPCDASLHRLQHDVAQSDQTDPGAADSEYPIAIRSF
jgi:hypothetical protein